MTVNFRGTRIHAPTTRPVHRRARPPHPAGSVGSQHPPAAGRSRSRSKRFSTRCCRSAKQIAQQRRPERLSRLRRGRRISGLTIRRRIACDLPMPLPRHACRWCASSIGSAAQTCGVDRLRPWDLSVDPKNRPPLRPFDEVERERLRRWGKGDLLPPFARGWPTILNRSAPATISICKAARASSRAGINARWRKPASRSSS